MVWRMRAYYSKLGTLVPYVTTPISSRGCHVSRPWKTKRKGMEYRGNHITYNRTSRYDLVRHGSFKLKMLFWRSSDENKLVRTWRTSRRILCLEVGQKVTRRGRSVAELATAFFLHVTGVSHDRKVPDAKNKGAEGASFASSQAVGFRYAG